MTRTKIQEIKLKKNKKTYTSFRGSYPKALIEALRGKANDQLDWSIMDGKLVAEVIRK